MSFRLKTLGGALATGAAAVMFAAGPAVAGTDIYVDTTDPFSGGAAGFKADGEIYTVCDNRSDGMRASAHIGWIDSSASHWIKLEDTNGSGNACARMNLEIAEGESVAIEVCLKNGANGTPKYCATDRSGKA
ncbi:hypothetical protein [Streptomyces dysideae]|uniref:Ricin B lectin domain-containing protein n=1 Tax=Streptomyces dysideae TaxID=909626 RepID=A0A101V5S5_9ACTN|nr:hypothetical protein [Streptomyces dysideae]KUO23013.1 hypothetical protein AQJ91_01415 [Streptomyces dysideae]